MITFSLTMHFVVYFCYIVKEKICEISCHSNSKSDYSDTFNNSLIFIGEFVVSYLVKFK